MLTECCAFNYDYVAGSSSCSRLQRWLSCCWLCVCLWWSPRRGLSAPSSMASQQRPCVVAAPAPCPKNVRRIWFLKKIAMSFQAPKWALLTYPVSSPSARLALNCWHWVSVQPASTAGSAASNTNTCCFSPFPERKIMKDSKIIFVLAELPL